MGNNLYQRVLVSFCIDYSSSLLVPFNTLSNILESCGDPEWINIDI
ncbi:MAG: hypothetical protein Q4Q23_04020 [Methanobacteriaceae archaeon]|nr:hypothetical protein [Methanobacteriaceae archaeon]